MNRKKYARGAIIWLTLALTPLACLPSQFILPQTDDGDETFLDESKPVHVKHLACEIDCLEKCLECYGSVTPKHADVWGQARLMMHRHEYEQVVRNELGNFKLMLQGSITRTDEAYLAMALNLGIAVTAPTSATAPAPTSLYTSAPTPAYKLGTEARNMVEPSIYLNQLDRYLHHLHELRRINEGDDNADAPGYALNLVRLPVSVLTGGLTQHGHGAEITFTISPFLTDELLPKTFHNLVVHDLVDQFTLPIAQYIGAEDTTKLDCNLKAYDALLHKKALDVLSQRGQPQGKELRNLHQEIRQQSFLKSNALGHSQFRDATLGAGVANVPSRSRVSILPLPPSQLIDVFGDLQAARVIDGIYKEIRSHGLLENMSEQKIPYHLDIASALNDELEAAYNFLSAEHNQTLWTFCTPDLARVIRTRDLVAIEQMRSSFFESVWRSHPGDDEHLSAAQTMTTSLAWAIVVESALLNEKLVEDMRATKAAKGMPDLPPGGLLFFGPSPPADARSAFNRYVEARWPIHVFALDPVTEEQNIGDSFASVREAQLAVAIAFASGQVSGSSAMNYMRKLTRDIETISLNRTVVGFSHGDNVFGWRFYPRVQTPPFKGTLATVKDLITPGDDKRQDRRTARLENGQRECIALVVMPSFVPYVTIESTSCWFRLNNPKCKALDMNDAMRLSRKVQRIRTQAPRCEDSSRYVGGDLALMLKHVDQIAARLPLQTQMVEIPYENAAGGFELFSVGVTDLAPQLNGYYGAPGINCNKDAVTSLFLVGANFSVHQTRVIVGGLALDPSLEPVPSTSVMPPPDGGTQQSDSKKQSPASSEKKKQPTDGKNPMPADDAAAGNGQQDGDQQGSTGSKPKGVITGVKVTLPTVELLSRQVMRISIPAGALSYINKDGKEVVDIYIATPYGISRHLSVPVYPPHTTMPVQRMSCPELLPEPAPAKPMPPADLKGSPAPKSPAAKETKLEPELLAPPPPLPRVQPK